MTARPLPLPDAPDETALPDLYDVAAFLAGRFEVAETTDVPLLWHLPPGDDASLPRPIKRIGLALDSRVKYVEADCDALFFHRPFQLSNLPALPPIPIFSAHHSFDTHLSIGFNPLMAGALGMHDLMPLFRDGETAETGEPIGMVGDLQPAPTWYALRAQITAEFGGTELIKEAPHEAIIGCLAVVGAMTPDMINKAAERGASVYVTGQFRAGASEAAAARNMTVIAVGHRRAEMWGLRRLARELTEKFPGLDAVILG